jgi:unsaturated rhamnogalacturonyl hydrolase
MKPQWHLSLPILLGILSSAGAQDTADVFAPAAIHRLLVRVNDWQAGHPAMKPDDRNWERGTWYTGVMAAYKATGDERFLKQALDWGRQHRWQVGTERAGANRLFCVETWAELFFVKRDKAMIAPAIEWLKTPARNSPAGAKVWYLDNGLGYADSLYGAPALAMMAKATGDKKYLDTMHAFFWDIQAALFDKDDGLFYRDKRFIGRQNTNGKKVFWSRGNGWVLGGIVRILEYLPQDDHQRPRYVELLKTMSAAIAKRQGADGLWRPNLADPNDVAVPETSGTGFFCYGMAWGIKHGLLDRERYLPVVKKAWAGLVKSVSPEGKVRWGQPVGDRPAGVTMDLTHEYVTGTFLLAGSAMVELLVPSSGTP